MYLLSPQRQMQERLMTRQARQSAPMALVGASCEHCWELQMGLEARP